MSDSNEQSATARTRRCFLKRGMATGLGLFGFAPLVRGERVSALPPVRTITRGPRHHWFGYYDKLQFDPSGRYVLGMEVDFEHRAPRADDLIHAGMIDLQDGDRWIELGRTTAWCWQQGCMLQWVPGSKTHVLWNDREGTNYVCRIMDVKARNLRTIAHPIYALSPNGKSAVSLDFGRLGEVRPVTGTTASPTRTPMTRRRRTPASSASIWRRASRN